MYKDVKTEKPNEGDKVLVAIFPKQNLKPAIYKNGKFLDLSDESIELFPTHWKYPNVPFMW